MYSLYFVMIQLTVATALAKKKFDGDFTDVIIIAL